MKIRAFFDAPTSTLTYLVFDEASRAAVVIDPVLDYDPAASRVSYRSVDELSKAIDNEGLRLAWVLETHAHADHLSSAQVLRQRFDARVAIGERITIVQETFRDVFGLPQSFPVDGSQFDKLLADEETLDVGALEIKALPTPGHTPACLSYVIGDAVFTGDALFTEDYGTGRTDFPKGSASALYRSVHNGLYRLPDETRVFVGHDYQPGGREVRYETTIGRSKAENPQLREATQEAEFVAFRQQRDATLAAPRLIYPSVQINIRAGHCPEPNPNGQRYLRIPLHVPAPLETSPNP
ncbi:MAG: MBL fold metallo-hydrolase [Myxococcota bacterium]